MRTAVVLVILAVAATACAGTNPGVKIYVSFDLYGPPVHSIETELYTVCDAYIFLSDLDGGSWQVVFRLNSLMEDYPGVFATLSFVPIWWGP